MLVRAGTQESAFGPADIVHVHRCQNGVCVGSRKTTAQNSGRQDIRRSSLVIADPSRYIID